MIIILSQIAVLAGGQLGLIQILIKRSFLLPNGGKVLMQKKLFLVVGYVYKKCSYK